MRATGTCVLLLVSPMPRISLIMQRTERPRPQVCVVVNDVLGFTSRIARVSAKRQRLQRALPANSRCGVTQRLGRSLRHTPRSNDLAFVLSGSLLLRPSLRALSSSTITSTRLHFQLSSSFIFHRPFEQM